MKLVFDFDANKCTACGACAIACMDENDIDIEAGQRPYRRILCGESQTELVYLSAACLHCPEPPCVPACPKGCLYCDLETGLVGYDNAGCVGCHLCEKACPYEAISFRPTGEQRPRERMEKCHGCLAQIQAGRDPACVRACPTGALTWHWVEEALWPSPLAQLLKRWDKGRT